MLEGAFCLTLEGASKLAYYTTTPARTVDQHDVTEEPGTPKDESSAKNDSSNTSIPTTTAGIDSNEEPGISNRFSMNTTSMFILVLCSITFSMMYN